MLTFVAVLQTNYCLIAVEHLSQVNVVIILTTIGFLEEIGPLLMILFFLLFASVILSFIVSILEFQIWHLTMTKIDMSWNGAYFINCEF